jgi:hypothetical protein
MKQVYHTETSNLTEEHFQQMLHDVPEFRRQHALSYRNRNDTILCLAAYQLLKQALGTEDNPIFYRNNLGTRACRFNNRIFMRGIACWCQLQLNRRNLSGERIAFLCFLWLPCKKNPQITLIFAGSFLNTEQTEMD